MDPTPSTPELNPNHYPVLVPPQAPMQGMNFARSQGGAGREGDPSKPGLFGSLANTGLDMLLGNKPGPSDRLIYHMGGSGDGGSSLTGQLTPQMLQQLEAIQAGRLGNAGQVANTFNSNAGGY